jgi:hypothetical protein
MKKVLKTLFLAALSVGTMSTAFAESAGQAGAYLKMALAPEHSVWAAPSLRSPMIRLPHSGIRPALPDSKSRKLHSCTPT